MCNKADDYSGKKAYAVEKGEAVVYSDTYCHPSIIRKYGKTERIVGGILIVITLGIAKATGVPWFIDSQEVCMNCECRKPPGSRGCWKVGEKHELSTITGDKRAVKSFLTLDHTNTV